LDKGIKKQQRFLSHSYLSVLHKEKPTILDLDMLSSITEKIPLVLCIFK